MIRPSEAVYIDNRADSAVGASKLGIKTIIYKNVKLLRHKLRKEQIL